MLRGIFPFLFMETITMIIATALLAATMLGIFATILWNFKIRSNLENNKRLRIAEIEHNYHAFVINAKVQTLKTIYGRKHLDFLDDDNHDLNPHNIDGIFACRNLEQAEFKFGQSYSHVFLLFKEYERLLAMAFKHLKASSHGSKFKTVVLDRKNIKHCYIQEIERKVQEHVVCFESSYQFCTGNLSNLLNVLRDEKVIELEQHYARQLSNKGMSLMPIPLVRYPVIAKEYLNETLRF